VDKGSVSAIGQPGLRTGSVCSPSARSRRGIHRSVANLERDIHAFITATNADPRLFRWVKAADDILASVKRFCLQMLGAPTVEEALARTPELGR
jgi:hypothetical protein